MKALSTLKNGLLGAAALIMLSSTVSAAVLDSFDGATTGSVYDWQLNVAGQPQQTHADTRNMMAIYRSTNGGQSYGAVNAGAFDSLYWSQQGSNDFIHALTFCIEPDVYFGQSGFTVTDAQDVSYGGQSFAGTIDTNLDRLFTNAFDLVTDRASAAAMQMAIWEVVSDTAGSYSLSDGNMRSYAYTNNTNIRPTNAENSQAFALADQWLSELNNGGFTNTGGYNMTYLVSGHHQNQVSVSPAPVPLPASAFMLLIGVGGLGGMSVLRRA